MYMDRIGLPAVWLLLALFAGGSVAAGKAGEPNRAELFFKRIASQLARTRGTYAGRPSPLRYYI